MAASADYTVNDSILAYEKETGYGYYSGDSAGLS